MTPRTHRREPAARDDDLTTNCPPHVLRDYALVADGERGALIGPGGDVAWLCAPRWDSDAVFAGLIGGRGGYTVAPRDRHVWGGYYEPGTLIWRSRWVTTTQRVECREALAYPADPHRVVLLRRVMAIESAAHVRIALQPRGGFGKQGLRELRCADGVWTARTGDLRVRWTGGADARVIGGGSDALLGMDLTVSAGQHHDLVLEISDATLPDDLPRADDLWRATEAAWADQVPALDMCLSPRDTRHSYAVLRGLTGQSGGMVAAATTSLPERAESGRNYDYRYVWIRDQCLAAHGVAAAGPHGLLDDAVRFVSARLLEHGPDLAPAYTATGDDVPDERQLKLPGYPGGTDRIGNWVNKQFQLDAFGESLLLFAEAERHGHMDADSWRAAQIAADAIAARWTEPDAGIWELEPRAWTHSRLMCTAGLRAIASQSADRAIAGQWLSLADTILADTTAHGLHPSGRWQRAPDDPAVDGALLLAGIRGAVPADDPRTIATLAAVEEDLTLDGYAYRFRHDARPLPDAEGSFLLCGFLMALAKHPTDEVSAVGWYERTRAACGSPALYAEEFDTREHQLRGNLPQAFVHALHLETAVRLNETNDRPEPKEN